MLKKLLGLFRPSLPPQKKSSYPGPETRLKPTVTNREGSDPLAERAVRGTPEFQRILDCIEEGVPAVFVTGKAGTGKSTLIRALKASVENLAVVAPTGIAAHVVSGMTLHRLFRIPSRYFDANDPVDLDEPTRATLKAIEVLVIDEVSMVGPQIIDRVDRILKFLLDKTGRSAALPSS